MNQQKSDLCRSTMHSKKWAERNVQKTEFLTGKFGKYKENSFLPSMLSSLDKIDNEKVKFGYNILKRLKVDIG